MIDAELLVQEQECCVHEVPVDADCFICLFAIEGAPHEGTTFEDFMEMHLYG